MNASIWSRAALHRTRFESWTGVTTTSRRRCTAQAIIPKVERTSAASLTALPQFKDAVESRKAEPSKQI
jgi:hypothetical protein